MIWVDLGFVDPHRYPEVFNLSGKVPLAHPIPVDSRPGPNEGAVPSMTSGRAQWHSSPVTTRHSVQEGGMCAIM